MAWITLHRDRLGLALYAIVPVLFLTIFASVFQGFGRHGENKVRVALLDLDGSDASAMLAQAARDGSARIDLVTVEGDGVEDLGLDDRSLPLTDRGCDQSGGDATWASGDRKVL